MDRLFLSGTVDPYMFCVRIPTVGQYVPCQDSSDSDLHRALSFFSFVLCFDPMKQLVSTSADTNHATFINAHPLRTEQDPPKMYMLRSAVP